MHIVWIPLHAGGEQKLDGGSFLPHCSSAFD
jgi:hypothetical protein